MSRFVGKIAALHTAVLNMGWNLFLEPITRPCGEEGLLLGPSAGANVHAAREVARRMEPGQRVVTILCDTGERYFS